MGYDDFLNPPDDYWKDDEEECDDEDGEPYDCGPELIDDSQVVWSVDDRGVGRIEIL